jgi:hypothetical protein
VKNPDEILIPTSDLVLITLREDESGECIPFTPLDDLPLDLGHGSGVTGSVSGLKSPNVRIVGLAYVVRSPIASRTAWVSSSNRLPINLR